MEQPGVGERTYAPQPLPVPSRPRTRMSALVVVLVVLILCGCCSCMGLSLGFTGIVPLPFDPFAAFDPPGFEYRNLWWVGERVLIQAADEEGRPYVTAWDPESGEERAARGMRVAGIEPHAPVVWLVEDSGADEDAAMALAEGMDERPTALYRWSLETTGDPVPIRSETATWSPWRSPDGSRSAVLEVRPAYGAMPLAIHFNSAEGTISALPPEDFGGTYAPIGFSPSGRYFAAYTLYRAISDAGQRGWEEGEGYEGDTRRVIFDTSTGRVVAEEPFTEELPASGVQWGVWDVKRDLLYYPYMPKGGFDGQTSLAALDPLGKQRDAFAVNGWDRPEAFEGTDQVLLVGTGSDGPVVSTSFEEPQYWQLSSRGPRELPVHAVGVDAVWSERGFAAFLDDARVAWYGVDGRSLRGTLELKK